MVQIKKINFTYVGCYIPQDIDLKSVDLRKFGISRHRRINDSDFNKNGTQ
jgi:hypothetical protein